MTHSRRLRLAGLSATLGAALGLAGDFVLLEATHYGTQDGLLCGHLLGVFGIPLYGLGYWQASHAIRFAAPRRAAVVLFSGMFLAALGSAIHGITGALLVAAPVTASGGVWAYEPYGAYVWPVWGVAALLLVVASLCLVAAVIWQPTPYPRFFAVFSPALLVLGIGLVSLPFPELRRFLAPAAPNLAHVIFFSASTFWLWKVQPR